MTKQDSELVRGSGNVFRDFGDADADILQMKAILSAEIIKRLDKHGLSVRGAQAQTGIAAADFSRIRQAELGRFSIDRLMTIILRLGARVDLAIKERRPESVRQRRKQPAKQSRNGNHPVT